ncbi:HK97 gp10 family phage protein [Paenibacillus sp. O199]|uniref:HK97 gp10 family phage protein n=1 Tax=Paenibacillus sp. O199 TaxID=1643925 RepID=UPI0007BF1DC8|nr:HK97 gp10 family phage protein [Paenibacillus sp. O199]
MSRNRAEIRGLDELISGLDRAANGGLRQEYAVWLDAMGFEFLELIQDEIIRTKTVDTRRLLNSFDRGDGDNVWSMSNGGLRLEVGTNLEYAQFVNDGHWTTKEGVQQRWVPGRWHGERFDYDPGASTGMMLRRQWIEGTHYWDTALMIFERLFERSLERRLQEWLDALPSGRRANRRGGRRR